MIASIMMLSFVVNVGAVVVDLTPDYAKPGATIDVLSWEIVGPSGGTTLTAVSIGFNGTDSDDVEYAMIYVTNTTNTILYQTLYGPIGTVWDSYVIPEGENVTVTLVFQIDDDAAHGNEVDGKIVFYTMTKPGGSGTDPQPIDPDGYTIIDAIKPVVVSATAVPDPAKAGLVTVTVVFNETMKTSVSPSVTVTGLASSPYPVGQSSYSGDTWVGNFTLLDDNEETTATIAVGLGQDVAGNVMDTNSSAGTFYVDTKAPTASIWVSDTLINEADDGGYFLVNVTFSETMDTGVTPVIDFDPDVKGSGTLTFSSDGWSLGGTRYTANYTIDDDDEEQDDVDVSVSGAEDLVGNEGSSTVANMFDVDTRKPVVIGSNISPDTLIIETDIPGTFQVIVTFNETMDTGVTPVIDFDPDVEGSGTLTFSSGAWTLGDTRYTATYTIADINEEQDDVDIDYSGAKDLAGNTQVTFNTSNVFDVDTIAPVITSIHWSVDGMPVTIPETDINVTLIGETGYTATFDIVGVGSSDLVTGVSMVEGPTGIYNGTYTVQYGDDGTYLIDGYLEDGAGNVASIFGTTNHPCTLYTVGNATSEWSSDESHSGSYSVELYVGDGSVDWAEVSIPVDIALKDIAKLKFWEYIDSYYPSDLGWSVNIVLGIDADGDGDFEADVAEWHVGTNSHTLTPLNGDSFVQMDGAQGDPTTGIWTETDALSIAQWWTPNNTGAGFAKSATYTPSFYGSFTNFVNVFLPDVTQTSLIPDANARVKCIKLVIGGSGNWMNETAYVDDLRLNSIIYNLELPFKIDTVPPSVVSLTVSHPLINEADDSETFYVTVSYDEPMNTSIAPTITFDPGVSTTLTSPGGLWITDQIYKANYTIDDADVEQDDVDVNVTGAEDLAGKTQFDYSAPDKFDIDTIAPIAPTGLDAPLYINIANQSAFPVSGSAENDTTVRVRLDDGVSLVITDFVHLSGSFSFAQDASVLKDGPIKIAACAIDEAGNTGPYSANITRTKDTIRPTVSIADADPDPTTNGTVTVTVVFSETMKTSVSPTVEVTGLDSSPYAVSEDTYSGDTWNGTFTLLDDNEEEEATISVSLGRDLADNMMIADTSAGTFDVDTEEPTVDLWVSDTLITEADIPGTFLINATFSEPMNTAVIPTIGFDSAAASTLTYLSGSWVNSTLYSVEYTLVDANVEATGIDVNVTGAEDAIGNSQDPDPTEETDMFDIDTIAPTVSSIWVSDELINEADDGGYFLVNVTFSETMNTGVTPDIDFTPNVETSGTLTLSSDGWSLGDTRYTANYTVADVNEEEDDVDVSVSGAEDLAGNEDPPTGADMFDIDTIAPIVLGIDVSDEWIKEDDIPGTFNVTVEFSEAMNTSVIPDILFVPGVSSTLVNQTGEWSVSDTVYTFTYDIADADVVVEDVNVTVGGAEDAAGNPDPLTGAELFDIDTLHHAGVPEYIDVWAEYSAPLSIRLNANHVDWPRDGRYSEWNSPENALASDDQNAFLTYADAAPFEVGMVLFFENPPEALEVYEITSVKLHVEQQLISDLWAVTEDRWLFEIGSESDEPYDYEEEFERVGTATENELSIDITEAIDDSYALDWEYIAEMAVAIYPEYCLTPMGEWYIDNVWIEVNYVYEDEGPSIKVPVSGEANVYAYVTDWFNDTVPDDTLITFETDLGTIYPLNDNTTSGLAMTTLISTDVGTATVNATGSLDGYCEVTFVAHTLDVELSPGWNLISVPRRLENSSIEAVFEGITTITKIYTYQDGNWAGSAYDGAWNELISGFPIEDIEDGIGYWVYATEPTTVTLSLEPLGYVEVIPPDYDLSRGWTMIGYTTLQLEPEMPVPVYLTNLDGVWQSLYSFAPAAGYEQAKPNWEDGFDNTELGRGYWIYLNDVGVLVP